MLKLNGLNIFYGDAQAVNDLSIMVEKGTLAALVGANGAGKSTTLLAIAGLIRPRSGTVEFMGQKIDELAPTGADFVYMPNDVAFNAGPFISPSDFALTAITAE